jgi:hypothetical protein
MQKVELRCEICHMKFNTNYNIPKVLGCGHTVCSKCVDRMREKDICKCPFDRRILDLEDDKIAINYYILSLIDNSITQPSPLNFYSEEEEVFRLDPQPVINSPGWKNTLAGFVKNEILYTVESNGFIYCTDLNTGEWWFMYHNQFFGHFFFMNPIDSRMYLIDQSGSLFQIFRKNYYVQIGKKSAWKNTAHLTVFNNKIFSVESSQKFYETNLQNGKWKEIMVQKQAKETTGRNFLSKSSNFINPQTSLAQSDFPYPFEEIDDIENKVFKNVNMLISNSKCIIFSNKNGDLILYDPTTGDIKKMRNDFHKNIESYSTNSSDVYFFEKNSKIIYRMDISSLGFSEKDKDQGFIDINSNNKCQFSQGNNGCVSSITITPNELDNSVNNKFEKLEINTKKSEDAGKEFPLVEIFMNLDDIPISNKALMNNLNNLNNLTSISPVKVIADDNKLCLIDKIGDLYVIDIKTKLISGFQCLFMIRNCHLQNTALIGDGDLLLLDPIRLSLNKLNILAGTEVIILHSTKFLYSIKYLFSASGKIYIIDTSGNLYFFNESDKKLTQVGNNSICKYILDYAVYKNYLLTIENHTLYRTNLSDGNYIEIKNDFCKNYEYFFADNAHIVFITNDDFINIMSMNLNTPLNKEKRSSGVIEGLSAKDQIKLKISFKYDKISKMAAVTYFRNHVVFYNQDSHSIETVNVEDKSHKVLVEKFPEVSMFINNNDILACILKDGVIYKLYY